jgi:hypothetical protein
MIKIVRFIKDFLIFSPLIRIVYPFKYMFSMLVYLFELNNWVRTNSAKFMHKDAYSFKRDYNRRFFLYQGVIDVFQLSEKPVTYLEFGVAAGNSFKWWLSKNSAADSRFFGVDTFEGLPEDWGGFYKKGDMISAIPEVNDERATFLAGLFQDTFQDFVKNNRSLLESDQLKVIHLDADIYSATCFVLGQIYPFLKKGDVIMFDEFNVPLHEFKAFLEFTKNYYVDLKPLIAVNNYYQVSFTVEKV